MAEQLKVAAEAREKFGKGAARRLRQSGRIPAIVYGAGEPAVPVAVDPKSVARILHSGAGHNALFMLEIPGQAPVRAMLREWQHEPVRGALLHVDMVRIASDARLRVRVPIQTVGEPQGVKLQGGVFEFVLREIEVECMPDDIPEHIEVNVSGLAIGQNVRVSDLPVAENVKVLAEPARVVAHVLAPKAEEAPAAEVAEAAPSEPELIRKRKAEEEGAEQEKGEAKAEK